jgi:hypothetical protein
MLCDSQAPLWCGKTWHLPGAPCVGCGWVAQRGLLLLARLLPSGMFSTQKLLGHNALRQMVGLFGCPGGVLRGVLLSTN